MSSQPDEPGPDPAADLRRRAEEQAGQEAAPDPSLANPQGMVHELRVHEIELELQNEELRRAQLALEAARMRYFDLYDLAPVGYLSLNRDGSIQEANLTAANQLGVVRSALVGQALTRFILSNDRAVFAHFFAAMWKSAEPLVCEVRMARSLGRIFWARLEMSQAQPDAGGRAACRLVISDINKQKQTEAALQAQYQTARENQSRVQQSEKLAALGRLVAGVAHEINGPLSSLLNHANRLQAAGLDEQSRQEAAGQILQAASRAARIVRDLLAFSRNQKFERRPLRLNSLLERCLEQAAADLQAGAIQAELDLDPDLPEVAGDPERLANAFLALIAFACQSIRAAADSGRLAIAAESGPPLQASVLFARAPVVRILFDSSAPPFSAGGLERVFDPFAPIDPAEPDRDLQLLMCFSIIELHGGRVWAENRPALQERFSGSGSLSETARPSPPGSLPGAGVRFIVELPVSGGLSFPGGIDVT